MEIIIANTNIGALLKSADNILEKYNKHEIPENIKGQATLSAIKHITQSCSFSVCSVDTLAQMNNVIISGEHQDFFRTLHCVAWKDMTEETREYLMAILIDYFRGNISMANIKENV